MRVLEKALVILVLIGIVFKLLHYPGGGLLIVIGLFLLSILYFALGWLLMRDRATKVNRLGISIPAGLSLSIICSGIMFKLQYWPGSGVMLLAGTTLLAAMMIATIAVRASDVSGDPGLKGFYNGTLKRLVIYAVIGAMLFLTPSSALLKLQYRDDPEYLEHLLKLDEDPDNEEYRREYEDFLIRRYSGTDTLN
jgi:hypothetical protein